MDSKYNKSKARKDAIKPALAFFTGLGSVFLVLHYAFGNKPLRRLPLTQAQTALQSLQNLPGATSSAAAGTGASELPEAFRSFKGPTEAQLRGAHFPMSADNSMECPSGSKILEDPESCDIASQVLHVKYTGEQRHAVDPPGCLYRTPDRDILWNQEEGGHASAGRKVVCLDVASLPAVTAELPSPVPAAVAPSFPAAVAPPAPAEVAPPVQETTSDELPLKMRSQDGRFAITDTEVNKCPSGSFPLQSKEECQEAAKSFDKSFMTDTQREELEPKGCVFRGPDQDLLWNADPEGSPHEARMVVCATVAHVDTAQEVTKQAEVPAADSAEPEPPAPEAAELPAPEAAELPASATVPAAPADSPAEPEPPALEAAELPASATVPPSPEVKYVIGSSGDLDCPPGSVPLTEPEHCEAAAKALSKEYVDLGPAEGDPPGCQYRPPDQDMYFNTHEQGAPNAGRQPVCRQDPAAAALMTTRAPAQEFKYNYVLGESDTADCPAGGTPVESSEECSAAAKKLGKIWLGEGNPAEMDPKGCQFRVPDQDMYWNPDETGATNAARQPVCRE